MAGSALAGGLTTALRLITKAVFEKSNGSLRKGASKFNIFGRSQIPKKKYPLSFGSKYACLKFHLLHFSSFVVIFLAISTFIELLCVILYAYIFPKLPIVKYYRSKAASEGSKTVAADLAAAGIQNQSDLVPFGSIKNTTSSFILQYLS